MVSNGDRSGKTNLLLVIISTAAVGQVDQMGRQRVAPTSCAGFMAQRTHRHGKHDAGKMLLGAESAQA
eukprot:212144-Amphidinium_carterae.1